MTKSINSDSYLNVGDMSLGARMAGVVVDRLKKGESVGDVHKALGIGYMSVYKIAIGKTWKSLTGGKRLIPGRKPRIQKKHRDFVALAKARNKTNASIARKLGVSETTVARLISDHKMILAHRLRDAIMTSGSEDAGARAIGIKPSETEELLLLAAKELPKRLREFVEE